jgi:hypothetical protein
MVRQLPFVISVISIHHRAGKGAKVERPGPMSVDTGI